MQIPDFESVMRELRRRDPRLYILERRVGIDVARTVQSFLPLRYDDLDSTLFTIRRDHPYPYNPPIVLRHAYSPNSGLKRSVFTCEGDEPVLRAAFNDWIVAAEKHPELVSVMFEWGVYLPRTIVVKWYSF